MAFRLSFTILLLTSIICCHGQNSYAQSISHLRTALENNHPDSTRTRLLLDLALAYVYKPGSDLSDLDSAQLLIQQADVINSRQHNLYLEARSCFVRSNALRERGDVAHGTEYADKAIRLLSASPYKTQLGEAYIERAQYYAYYDHEELLKKRACWEKADSLFVAAGAREREAYALQTLGDLDYNANNYGQAMVELQRSLVIYNTLHYPAVQGVYSLMGVIALSMGDYPQAVKYGFSAVRSANAVNDTTLQLCTIYHRLSGAYTGWLKPAEALEYELKAYEIASKYKDREYIYTVLSSLIGDYLNNEMWQQAIKVTSDVEQQYPPLSLDDTIAIFYSYARSYIKGARLDKAKKYADMLVALGNNRKLEHENLYIIDHLMVLYMRATKQYHWMSRYVDSYIADSKAISFYVGLAWAYGMKAEADSGVGNYQSALRWFKLSKNLSDSMFNATKGMQFAQIQIQYETEKKDKDLQLLANKNQLQELSLKKASLTRNIIIAGAIAALLLLVVAFRAYRIKQRHNALLQRQQEEINSQNQQLRHLLVKEQKLVDEKQWLVREIHHRVKNNLQLVISLLNTQSEFLDSPSAFSAIRESRQRMQAIAIIHQKLYQPDVDTFIDMCSYISEMIGHMRDSFSQTEKIRFIVDVGKVSLDVSHAVPLGLIINEAITNAIKHAFPGDHKGSITISLHQLEDQHISLEIVDDARVFLRTLLSAKAPLWVSS